jgi:hypothetical protein
MKHQVDDERHDTVAGLRFVAFARLMVHRAARREQ